MKKVSRFTRDDEQSPRDDTYRKDSSLKLRITRKIKMNNQKKHIHTEPRYKNIIFAALFVLGIFLLYLGLRDNGFVAVLRKATFICLECIGIG